jgi:hypothetical protein
MSLARLVITKSRPAKMRIAICSTSTQVEHVCLACATDTKGDMCSCGYCYVCCVCERCPLCMHLILDEEVTSILCPACRLCVRCCRCYTCPECKYFHTHMSLLCEYCGRCKKRTCGCTHYEDGKGPEYFRSTVNLARYRERGRRLLSAEIEVCGIAKRWDAVESVVKAWNGSVVEDGSLPYGGFEINTHPASGRYWDTQIREICEALKAAKAYVTQAAGCHMHVDCRDFNYTKLALFVRILAYVEGAMFCMVPVGRRTNGACTPCGLRYVQSINHVRKYMDKFNERQREVAYRQAILTALYGFYKKSDVESVRKTKRHMKRYRSINLHSWVHRGTVEVRIPQGMVYPENIINWGLMLEKLANVAETHTHDSIESVIGTQQYWSSTGMLREPSIALLKSLCPELEQWIDERIRYFDNPDATYDHY